VARPDVDLVELRGVAEVEPTRLHEPQRALDLGRDHFVPASLRRRGDELLVPGVHLVEVGEAALRERADEVERRRRLVIAVEHPLRVGDARLGSRGVVVNHVTAERRDLLSPDQLRGLRPGLDELPRDPADLHDRQRGAVRQHGRHLQEDLQLLADRDRGEVVERLGAIARLKNERASVGDLGERPAKGPRLAREDQRWELRETRPERLRLVRARPLRLLRDGQLAPRRRRPSRLADGHAPSLEAALRPSATASILKSR
jgi:hypothetical protein